MSMVHIHSSEICARCTMRIARKGKIKKDFLPMSYWPGIVNGALGIVGARRLCADVGRSCRTGANRKRRLADPVTCAQYLVGLYVHDDCGERASWPLSVSIAAC